MRNMSFSLTIESFENRTKTVTRRLGWANLKPGDRFMGVVKTQGLKRGEHPVKLHVAEVVSNTSEPLRRLIDYPELAIAEIVKEALPGVETPDEFVDRFIALNLCTPDTIVNRIEFKHL